MEGHEIQEPEGGRYIIARSKAGQIGVTYRYEDGREIPASPEYVDWMPEVLRLEEREQELRAALDSTVLFLEVAIPLLAHAKVTFSEINLPGAMLAVERARALLKEE